MSTIYACRGDGLGTRLLSIIYGRILAEMLDLEFKVIWPELGSPYYSDYTVLDPAGIREVFADKFVFTADPGLQGEFVHNFSLDNSEVLSLYHDEQAKALRDMDLEEFRRSIAPYKAILYDYPGPLLKFMNAQTDLSERVKHIWTSIAWSEGFIASLENVRRFCAVHDMIAVHVRRGDVLEMLVNADVDYLNSPSVMETLLQRYAAVKTYINTINSLRTTEDVLLFSEEPDVKKYFVDTYGSNVHSSYELYKGTPNQRAFADLALMAESKLLVAPVFSAFSGCAASVGKCIFIQVARDPSSLVEELNKKLDDEAAAGRISFERSEGAKAAIYAHASSMPTAPIFPTASSKRTSKEPRYATIFASVRSRLAAHWPTKVQ